VNDCLYCIGCMVCYRYTGTLQKLLTNFMWTVPDVWTQSYVQLIPGTFRGPLLPLRSIYRSIAPPRSPSPTTTSLSTRSVRYDRQQLWRLWCVSIAVLKIMWNLVGSQGNCCSAEVTGICDCQSRLSTNRVATFCTRCRSASDDAGRSENMELQ